MQHPATTVLTTILLASMPPCAVHAANAAWLQDEPKREAPPADQPTQKDGAHEKTDDVLRGPVVPKKGVQSDRQFTGGKPASKDGAQKPAIAPGSRPTIELNAFVAAIESMRFEGELATRIEEARQEFAARMSAWEKSAGERRKQLYEKRRKASPTEPPSEEFKKEMQAIEASRPKVAEFQQRVYGMLTEEKGNALKDAFDGELARVRAELARKAEADRKAEAERRAEAERKKREAEGGAKDERGAPGSTPPGGSGGAGGSQPPKN